MKGLQQMFKSMVLKLSVLGLLLVPALPSGVASAQTACLDDPSQSISACLNDSTCVDDEQGCDPEGATDQVNTIISLIINIFSVIVGVVSVIMIIIGGLKYITSGGDSNNITGAKNTILYAIIGLVVVALAQVIVRFVLQRATSNI